MTIQTTAGEVSGTTTDGIGRFLGVPYAQPPVGHLRFAAPVPVEPWHGVREAHRHGPTAVQDPYPGEIGKLLSSVAIDGDDILTLNVWTPAEADAAPVVLWIHGGAFERGTAALPGYDGSAFARDGVVFVSVNYRLGAEGFSVFPDAPRNLGLRDVALALQWVHREIAGFGGDPDRITVMGESAGGALAAALLVRPDTAGLISGAVIQSGPLIVESPRRAGRVTVQTAKRLGTAPTRAAFAERSAADILAARRELAAGSTPLKGAPGYALVLDPESLPASPHLALADVDVPVLIGTNTDEYRLWFPPAALAGIRSHHLTIARLALGISARALRAYRETWRGASAGELFGQLATDYLLRAPAVRAARSRRAPTYVYEFAWNSPVRELRAAHAMEIAFVFDDLAGTDAPRLVGTAAPNELAQRMHGDWVSFITTGDPGWPVFEVDETVQRYDDHSESVRLPRSAALDAMAAPRVR